jgi:hypothetical protein
VAAPASPLISRNGPAQLPGATSRRLPPQDPGRCQDRYWLHVVATSVVDVVTSIGGLIFDRAMAGWDVTVAVGTDFDDRPIRILGARVANLAAGSPARPHVLAVATDVFVTNEHLRRLVLAARKGNATDVFLWGRRHPPNMNGRFAPVRHRPSAAAQVFKSHAMAVRGPIAAGPTEEGFYALS